MSSSAHTPEEYLSQLPTDRIAEVTAVHETILKNLPDGFEAVMSYGMLGYVVPHKIYPAGYHCDPKLPLPFMALASQKNSINLYHMGLYAMPQELAWFVEEFPKYSTRKLDMGKSCLRFKPGTVPLDLVAALTRRIRADEWITIYETQFKK